MPTFSTACPRNCYSTCSMLVTVENNRVVRIEAHPENQATNQGVCLKGLSYVERQNSPDRLLNPLRKFQSNSAQAMYTPIDWDTALDEIAYHLQETKNKFF